jgi:type II secretory pathway pseudopilin PulG
MLPPLIDHRRGHAKPRSGERGFTMALVAVALVAIIAMAALSIDIGALYQAKTEAQRAADAAALTAARVISISGITGDPTNGDGSWSDICGGGTSAATLAAINVAQQNLINGVAPSKITVNYGVGSTGASNTTCVGLGAGFGVNPVVTVYVQQANLPTFFARVFSLIPTGTFSNSGVSATATAEVFNSSNSGSVAGSMIPVQPRCVKPWIIPNKDPGNGGAAFVSPVDGSIQNPGVLGGKVIGETFNLVADCTPGGNNCHGPNMPHRPAPTLNGTNLDYVPALVSGNPSAAPSCATANTFQEAIGGCDENTVYTCGTPSGTAGATQLDLNENPVNPISGGDTSTAAQCLINQSGVTGQDSLDTTTFPFQIKAGSGSALVQSGIVSSNNVITTSNSIVTVPIYDGAALPPHNHEPPVTIVGFLQVFVNNVNTNGNINVTVMNVAGCSNDAAGNPTVTGTSPVPIRLITPR